MIKFLCALVALLTPTLCFAQPPVLRTPALSPDGQTLAFSYQGDIWTVATTGGTARRLTIHESYEYQPTWSPDGTHIAFVGNRYGNNDVFVTDPAGSTPRRLTYHSAWDNAPTWLDNEQLLFTTTRVYRQTEWIPEVYRVSLNGETPVRYFGGLGNNPAANGDLLAFEMGECRVSREQYRGPANRELWLHDAGDNSYTQLTEEDGQDVAPTWVGDQLYFLSAKDGRYNLYRITAPAPAGRAQIEQLTKFKDWGIRNFTASADGNRIVIERGEKLELSENGGKKFRTLNIQVGSDFKFYPKEEKTLTGDLTDYALSPKGDYLAFVSRGEVFIKPNDKEKSRARNLSDHAYQDDNVTWLNDTTLFFVSDRAEGNTPGQPALMLARSAPGENAKPYLAFRHDLTTALRTDKGITSILLSPDRQRLAVHSGRGKLATYAVDSTGTVFDETVLLDGWDAPSGLSWSPDSKWLAYGLSDLNFNEEVYIHAADNSREPVNVSMHPRGDRNPTWSPDGSKLAFTSIRNNGDNDVWFVWLREADYEKTRRDWEEADEWLTEEKSKQKNQDSVTVEIDFEDIHERLVQVTSLPGNEGSPVFGPDGDYLYFITNTGSRAGYEGDSDLMKIKWDGKEMKPLLSNVRVRNLQLAPDGKKLFMLLRGKVASTGLSKGKPESQPVAAKMTVDHLAERRHLIHDGWSALEAGFYDPEFHGRDWAELREKYEPLMLAASTRQDFGEFYNEMLGQLNASHMGFSTRSRDEETLTDRTGQLGLELDAAGRISYVLPEGPADRTESRLFVGDRITAVNGEAINPGDNLFASLNGRANERIQLTVARADSTATVLIRPASSLRDARYEAWVDARRALVDDYSGGRLGYLHIRGMNWSSFERFERELTAAGLGKDGVVIDVRYNGGGWTTDMLMTVLNVRQHAYTVPRGAAGSLKENGRFRGNYPYGERLPQAALTKPSIALCNEASYSNAEIFSHAYKHLGHGTLVGQPTFGAVISTGSHRLLDGSRVRMPFRAWYVHATEQNMEGGPAVPDVVVENAPNYKELEQDSQLKKAVNTLLEQMSGKR